MSMLIALALLAAQAEPARPLNINEAEAVRAMHEFTACVVRERTGEARAVLAMDFRTAAYRRRILNPARATDSAVATTGWECPGWLLPAALPSS